MLHSICRLTIVFLTFVLSMEAATQVSVRASYGSLGVSQVILPLGVRSGVFQKNGLKFEPVYIAWRIDPVNYLDQVGSCLVRKLMDEGEEVVALDVAMPDPPMPPLRDMLNRIKFECCHGGTHRKCSRW